MHTFIRVVNIRMVCVISVVKSQCQATHFLTKCLTNETCAAVLAACNNLKITPTVDIILSDSRLHDITMSSLHRNFSPFLSLILVLRFLVR